MTNQQHPITPPLALIDQWWDEAKQNAKYDEPIGPLVANQAVQWGADQELEACKQWLTLRNHAKLAVELGLCMRNKPKPPSLKDQALQVLASAPGPDYPRVMTVLNADEHALIRRALEALPND